MAPASIRYDGSMGGASPAMDHQKPHAPTPRRGVWEAEQAAPILSGPDAKDGAGGGVDDEVVEGVRLRQVFLLVQE